MDSDGQKNWKKKIFTAARLLLALVLLVLLASRVHLDRLSSIRMLNLLASLGLAGMLMCLQISAGAYRWKLLLAAQGIKMPFSRAVSLSFQGNAFSLFLPGGALGGDVVKAAVLAAETRSGKRVEGITTVALDRLIGMCALFLLVLAVAAAGFHRIQQVDPLVRAGIYGLLVFCLIGVIIVGALFFQDLVFRVRALDFLRRKADILLKGKLTRVLEAISLYRRERMTLLKAFLISLFLVHPFLLSALYVILWGIQAAAPDFVASYLAISLGNSAAVIPVTPGGLGARDQIAAMVLKAFGIDPTSASLAPLCFSVTMILVAVVGLFCFAADSFRSRKTENSPAAELSAE